MIEAKQELVSAKSDKTREAFEAWAKLFGFPDISHHPTAPSTNYRDRDVTMAWKGWDGCAAANAQEVKRLREALEGLLNTWNAVCDVKGWDRDHMVAAEVARAALQGDK